MLRRKLYLKYANFIYSKLFLKIPVKYYKSAFWFIDFVHILIPTFILLPVPLVALLKECGYASELSIKSCLVITSLCVVLYGLLIPFWYESIPLLEKKIKRLKVKL